MSIENAASQTPPLEQPGPVPGVRVAWRREVAAALVCGLAGLTIAVLPHFQAWCATGSPVWVADYDDAYYLAIAGQAYHGHPFSLSDPVSARGEFIPHRPLALLPGVWVARVLGWGPMGINLAWRIWAGLSVGLGLFLVARVTGLRTWVAAGLAVLLLSDAGLSDCRPLVRQAALAGRVVSGRTEELFRAQPIVHPAWRIVTPAAAAVYLLVHVGLLLRARRSPGVGWRLAAGLAFGLLFHVYFYYWTAAGLGLVLAFLLDRGHRGLYVQTALVGGLVGLPAVIGDVLARRSGGSDWLNRTDKFLPVGHFRELLIPGLSLVLLVLALVWVWRRRRDLLPLWSLAAAALVLANHVVVSGLEIENFHWNSYVFNPMLELLLALLVAGWAAARSGVGVGPRWRSWALGVGVAAYFGVGLWLRGVESARSAEPVALGETYRAYQAGRTTSEPLATHALMAGDAACVLFGAILETQRPLSGVAATLSPAVSDPAWNERIALNDYLLWGDDRAAYEPRIRQDAAAIVWGPWGRDEGRRRALMDARLALRAAVAADPEAALARFPVRYLALPEGRTPPRQARLGWVRIRRGRSGSESCSIWERRLRPAADDPTRRHDDT